MTKLEKILQGMDIRDDVSLADVLMGIIDTQSMLPPEKRDPELTGEAVDALLMLRGQDPDILEAEADRLAKRIIAENSPKKHRRISRRLIPGIIAAALLLAGTCAVGYGTNFSVTALTKKILMSMKPGVEYGDENTTVIVAKDFAEYRSYCELFSAKPELELVYLERIPEGYSIERVLYADYVQYTDIAVSLTDNSAHKVIINVRIGTPADLSNRETVQIGGYDVATCYHGGNIQGDISVRDLYVTVTAPDEETLAATVEGLEERIPE